MLGIILGARPGTGNIGDAILREMDRRNWEIKVSDCLDHDGKYRIPTSLPYHRADALIVTLGYTRLTPFAVTTEDDIEKVIHGTLLLPLMAVKNYVQERMAGGQRVIGSISRVVVIGSYAHDHALTHCAAYCAAKAGLAAAIQELGWELTEEGFRFHIVHPYHVPSTPMGKEVLRGLADRVGGYREAEQYQRKDLKMAAHLTPLDIAEVVAWLLTEPAAEWLSGQGLNLYGGTR